MNWKTDKITVYARKLETRKVDNNPQGTFRKPTSIIRNRHSLEECGCVVLFIV